MIRYLPHVAAETRLGCLTSGDGLPGDGPPGAEGSNSLAPARRVMLTSPVARAAAMDRLMAFYGRQGEARTRLRGPA